MARTPSKGFLLRLDPQTMEQVEKWAAREFRSVNGQLQWIIADSLRRHGLTPHHPNDSNDNPDNPDNPDQK